MFRTVFKHNLFFHIKKTKNKKQKTKKINGDFIYKFTRTVFLIILITINFVLISLEAL